MAITVKELIEKLQKFDPNMEVLYPDNTNTFVTWEEPDPHVIVDERGHDHGKKIVML